MRATGGDDGQAGAGAAMMFDAGALHGPASLPALPALPARFLSVINYLREE